MKILILLILMIQVCFADEPEINVSGNNGYIYSVTSKDKIGYFKKNIPNNTYSNFYSNYLSEINIYPGGYIQFQDGDKTATLFWKNGKLSFEGDYDMAAKKFAKYLSRDVVGFCKDNK